MTLFSYRATPFTLSFRRRRVINRESTSEQVSTLFSLRTHARIHTEGEKRGGEERRRAAASVKQCPAKSDGYPPMGNLRVQCKKSSRRQGTWIRMKSGERRERLLPFPNLESPLPVVLTHPLSPSWFPEDIQRCKRIDVIVRFSFSAVLVVLYTLVLRLLLVPFDVFSLPRSNTFLSSDYCSRAYHFSKF